MFLKFKFFVRAAKHFRLKEKDEYFSQMINRMIQINQKVTCNKIGKNEKTIVLGTPEQYLLEIQK